MVASQRLTEAADLDAVREFIESADPEVAECRSMRHSLEKAVAKQDPYTKGWHVELACRRCTARFTMELDSKGVPVGRRGATYAKGYLFSGHGRMDPEGKGLVRLTWLTAEPAEREPEAEACPEGS